MPDLLLELFSEEIPAQPARPQRSEDAQIITLMRGVLFHA
jgi:glycyl-tRNA synthetase beta subunit